MNHGIFFGLLTGAIWGAVILAPAFIREFNALLISTVRFGLYGLISLAIALPTAARLLDRLTRKDLWMLLRLSLTGNILYFALLGAAVQFAGVTTASVINGMMPLAIAAFGRHDPGSLPLKRLALPLVVVFTGIVLISTGHAGHTSETAPAPALGILCAFLGVASWSWFSTVNGRYLRYSHFHSGEWSTLFGLATGVVAIVCGLGMVLVFPSMIPTGVCAERWTLFFGVTLALAVFGSWIANALWNACSRTLPASLTGQMIVFETLFACVYGFLYMQRWPSLVEMLSLGLLVLGVAWSSRLHRIGTMNKSS